MTDLVWRPSRFPTGLAIAVAAIACWRVASRLGVARTATLAVAGGALLAVVVGLADADRYEPVALGAAVVLGSPAGLAVAAAVAFVALTQLAGLTPVGTAFVVLGTGLAALGAVALPVGLDRPAAIRGLLPTLGGGVAALFTAGGAIVARVFAREEIDLPSLGIESLVGGILAPQPTPRPPIGTVLLAAGLAAWAARRTITRLPIRELAETERAITLLNRIETILGWWPVVAVAGAVVAVLNALLPPAIVWDRLPDSLVTTLGRIAAAPGLRAAAVGLIGVALLVELVVRLLRAGVTRRTGRLAAPAGLLAGWLLVAWVGWIGHATLVGRLRAAIRGVLPATVAEAFTREADAVVAYYGGPTVGLAVVALGAVLAAVAALGLAVGAWLALRPRGSLGPGALGGGTFLAGAFGLAAGVDRTGSVAVLVVSVLVWDLARTGTVLGREVGRRPTGRVTLVHAGGTVAVGVFALGATALLTEFLTVTRLGATTPAPLVLAAGAIALVLLGAAIHRL